MELFFYYGIIFLMSVFLLLFTSLIFMEIMIAVMDKYYDWKYGTKPWERS